MAIHELKTWPEFFEHIWHGTKTFELRENDRNFHIGDVLLLREYDPIDQEYSGRKIEATVTYMTNFENACALSSKALGRNFVILSFVVMDLRK